MTENVRNFKFIQYEHFFECMFLLISNKYLENNIIEKEQHLL